MGEFARLPGVGPRTAQRLAFHLMKANPERTQALADALVQMKERLRACRECFSFAEDDLCPICSDLRRDPSTICVVEEPSAIMPIEATHEFRGRYHVLGGALSPIDGINADDLRIDELLGRIARDGVRELVVATNQNMAGEATALYLAEQVPRDVVVSRLASGLPVGADLEHADELTVGRAFLGRREITRS